MKIEEYKKIAVEILGIYKEIDLKMQQFLTENKIGCVKSCGGKCCHSFDVMVSPIDLIPLAIDLMDKDPLILSKLNKSLNSHCLFWLSGKCSVYENRATLCRMFGLCSVYDKNHSEIISICKNIEKKDLKNNPPNLVDYSFKINNLVPSWDSRILPFNQSLKYAVEKILNSTCYDL